MFFAGLRRSVGNGADNEPDDIVNLKQAFATMGRLRAGVGGLHQFIDEPLVKAIETFQDDRALRMDGLVNPGGETERNVKRDLGQTRDTPLDLRELDLTGPMGNDQPNQHRDLQAVSKALGIVDLFNFDRTTEPPAYISERLDKAINKFQDTRGLFMDGKINPGGETMRTLKAEVAQRQGTDGAEKPAGSKPQAPEPEAPKQEKPKLVLPAGGVIRNDSQGQGHFGAPRGGERTHEGVDVTVKPGQPVPSPIDGEIVATGDVYGDKINNKGLRSTHIKGSGKYEGITVKVFYMDNSKLMTRTKVKAGELLGPAQDVRVKHGQQMKPHIHYKVEKDGKVIDPTGLLPKGK